jgi:hypothetical protein
MEDEVALFNGQDISEAEFNNDSDIPKKPIKAVQKTVAKPTTLDSYAKSLRQNTGNSAGYSSREYSSNFKGGLKFGSDDPFAVTQKEEANAESFGKQLAMFTGNTLSNIVTGTIGGVGYLGTLFEDSKGDYSNAITDWADSTRNPFGEIKRENNDTIDISDSGFWFNSGQSLVESAVQFGLIAETGGLLAGGVTAKLGNLLKLGNTALKGIKTGIQAMTSMELSYLEGAMSGATVYRDIYKNQYEKLVGKGLSPDEANKIAVKYASEGAANTVKLNTTIGTALNLTGIGSVFNRGENIVEKYFATGAGRRLSTDLTTKAYVARLASEAPEMLASFAKTNKGKLLLEAGQEGIEEDMTQLAENTGRKQGEESKSIGYLDSFKDAYNNLNTIVNDEGVLNFALGAVGGVAQTVLLDNIIPSQKVNAYDDSGKLKPLLDDKGEVVTKNGNPVYEQLRVSPKKRDALDNQRYYSDLKDALVADLTFIDNTQAKIEKSNDPIEKEELRRQLFHVNALDSIYKGVGSNLVQSYQKILEQDNTTDLSEQYIKKGKEIQKQMDDITSSVEKVEDLDEESKKQLEELKKLSNTNQLDITKYTDITPAMQLGLAKVKGDNDFKIRATKAINEINEIDAFHKKNKDKYILPEETNVNYAEFITKLQADVIGRNRIVQDLENDFLREKADFQLFSSIENYGEIEDILSNSELASLLAENDNLEKRRNTTNLDEIADIIDTLPNKVYDKEEVDKAINEKITKNNEKIDVIDKQIRETEDFKQSKETDINKYLESRVNKYADFNFLMDFKQRLDKFKRGTENIKDKIKDITSNKGRNKFIKMNNEKIQELKKQLEADHSSFSYQEAQKLNEDTYFFSMIDRINKEHEEQIVNEIKSIEEEVNVLEQKAKEAEKSSKYSSFLSYFKTINDLNYLISLRKNRLYELNTYYKRITTIRQQAKDKVNTQTNTGDKQNTLNQLATNLNNAEDIIDKNEEDLGDLAGNVVEKEGDEDEEEGDEDTDAILEAKRLKEEQDKKVLEAKLKAEEEFKLNNKLLYQFIVNKFSDIPIADIIYKEIGIMYKNNKFDFNKLTDNLLIIFNVIELQDIYKMKLFVIGLEPYVKALSNLTTKVKNDITKQIKAIKDSNIEPVITDEPPIIEEDEEIIDKDDQDNGLDDREEKDRLRQVPFRLDAFSIQYGGLTDNILTSDAKTFYSVTVGTEIEMKIDNESLNTFKNDYLDGKDDEIVNGILSPQQLKNVPISLFLEGIRKGYLPTLKFIDKTYKNVIEQENGSKVNAFKIYHLDKFENFPLIRDEYDNIIQQIEDYGLNKDSIVNNISNRDVHIDFYEFNFQKIEKIRNKFADINTSITKTVSRKSGGRAIARKEDSKKDVSDILKDSRTKIHAVIKGGIFPIVKYDNKDINLKESRVLGVISYPNAIGGKNIYPVSIKTLSNEKIDTLHYMFGLFHKANDLKSQEALNELNSIFNTIGFNSEGNTLNSFNKFINTYFTSINDYKTKPKLGVPVLHYFKINNGVEVNQFKISYLTNTGKIIEAKSNQGDVFLKALKQEFKGKLFTLDKNKLANSSIKTNYPILKNGKIEFVNQSYNNYIGNQLETRLEVNGQNVDKNGKNIYVQDFLLNLDNDFDEDNKINVNTVIEPIITEPIVTVPRTGRARPNAAVNTGIIGSNIVNINAITPENITEDKSINDIIQILSNSGEVHKQTLGRIIEYNLNEIPESEKRTIIDRVLKIEKEIDINIAKKEISDIQDELCKYSPF